VGSLLVQPRRPRPLTLARLFSIPRSRAAFYEHGFGELFPQSPCVGSGLGRTSG
jgi:hypothetical protein